MTILNGPMIPLLTLIGAQKCESGATCDTGFSCSTPYLCTDFMIVGV